MDKSTAFTTSSPLSLPLLSASDSIPSVWAGVRTCLEDLSSYFLPMKRHYMHHFVLVLTFLSVIVTSLYAFYAYRHLSSYRSPIQKFYLRIVGIVPLVTISGVLLFLYPHNILLSRIVVALLSCAAAYAVVCFYLMLVIALGGRKTIVGRYRQWWADAAFYAERYQQALSPIGDNDEEEEDMSKSPSTKSLVVKHAHPGGYMCDEYDSESDVDNYISMQQKIDALPLDLPQSSTTTHASSFSPSSPTYSSSSSSLSGLTALFSHNNTRSSTRTSALGGSGGFGSRSSGGLGGFGGLGGAQRNRGGLSLSLRTDNAAYTSIPSDWAGIVARAKPGNGSNPVSGIKSLFSQHAYNRISICGLKIATVTSPSQLWRLHYRLIMQCIPMSIFCVLGILICPMHNTLSAIIPQVLLSTVITSVILALYPCYHLMNRFPDKLQGMGMRGKSIILFIFFLILIIPMVCATGSRGYWYLTTQSLFPTSNANINAIPGHDTGMGTEDVGDADAGMGLGLGVSEEIVRRLLSRALMLQRVHAICLIALSVIGLVVGIVAFDDGDSVIEQSMSDHVEKERIREVKNGWGGGNWRKAGLEGVKSVFKYWDIYRPWRDIVSMKGEKDTKLHTHSVNDLEGGNFEGGSIHLENSYGILGEEEDEQEILVWKGIKGIKGVSGTDKGNDTDVLMNDRKKETTPYGEEVEEV